MPIAQSRQQGGAALAVLISIVVLAILGIGLARWSSQPRLLPDASDGDVLTLYCAAGIKMPVAELAIAYERAFGVPINIQYGGSGTLLSSLRVGRSGDLYLAADASYMELGRSQGLVAESLAVAQMLPVIAVQIGNPKAITSLADLAKPGVRLALGNPEAASVGQAARQLLTEAGLWEAVQANVVVTKPTVNEIATDLRLGTVDATIIWDSTVAIFNREQPTMEAVAIEGSEAALQDITIGVLPWTTQPSRALHFARYLASPEHGAPIFRNYAFNAEGGDAWADEPEIIFYSGTVNRPAVEKALKSFEQREGVRIVTKYSGCGILTADMRIMEQSARDNPGIRIPDAYYACDVSFVPPVADLYPETTALTETDIVIAVPKGNPKGITSLADLTQSGLRLGISNAEQATLGFMTRRLFRDTGIADRIEANIVVENPQADFLINHLHTGSVDAIIVYAINAGLHMDKFDTVAIDHPGAKATQPYSIAKTSPYRHITLRLLDHLRANKSDFQAVGFRWNQQQQAVPSTTFRTEGGPGTN